jgi:hypothetical protein
LLLRWVRSSRQVTLPRPVTGFFGGDEDAGDCCDYQIAEHGINIVPNYELEAECLVLRIVSGYLHLGGVVIVGQDCWWIDGFDERYVDLAARFLVYCVDGEIEVA